MAKKKYLKDENGITRALSTNELRLEKPLGNENYDVNVFNNNMDKIDVAIKNVKNDLSNIDLTAERVEYSKNECSNVDGALDKLFQSDSEIKTSILGIKDSVKSVVNSVSETDIASSKAVKIAYDKGTEALSKANEAFQNANNGKNIVATAIGSPLSSADTFATMGSKIDTLTLTFRNNLIDKGVDVSSSDKMSNLIDKVGSISLGKKWASGETISTSEKPNRVIFRGLDFKPSFAIAYSKNSNGWYKVGKMINMNGISSAFYNWYLPSGSGNQTIHTYDISSVLFEDGCSMPVPSGNELYYWIAYE